MQEEDEKDEREEKKETEKVEKYQRNILVCLQMLHFTLQLVCVRDLRLLPTKGETADAKRP